MPLAGLEASLVHVTIGVAVDAVPASQVVREEPLVAVSTTVLQQSVAAFTVVFELAIVGGAVLEPISTPPVHLVAQVEPLVHVRQVAPQLAFVGCTCGTEVDLPEAL